jgi:hypothetical protein
MIDLSLFVFTFVTLKRPPPARGDLQDSNGAGKPYHQLHPQNYMETHVTRQPVLGELRQHVLMPLVGHPLFSDAEQLRANHFAYECEDVVRLIRWDESVQAEIARREDATRAEAAYLHRQCVLRNTLWQMPPASFRCHCPRRPALTQLASFPSLDQADRRAGTFDRLAASRFKPADSLTFASLLSQLRR